jgi:hypothetical protein
MRRTAVAEPSIVKTIQEKNVVNKWQGRNKPWKTMIRL